MNAKSLAPGAGRSLHKPWVRWVLAILVITPSALGVHEVMLEGLHVPFPVPVGLPLWASWLNLFFSVLALIVFCRLASEKLAPWRRLTRCLMLTLMYLMLNETFRVLLIDSVLTTSWWYQTILRAPNVLFALFVCSAVVLTSPYLRLRWALVFGALVISLVAWFAVQPLIGMAATPFLRSIKYMDLPERYSEPYPWQMFILIYATFVEPVIASLVLASMAWANSSSRWLFKIASFAGLLLFIKGSVFRFCLFSFWVKGPLIRAFLSESQFFLEAVVLALMAGAAWPWIESGKIGLPAARASD